MNTEGYRIVNSLANNTLNIPKKRGGRYDELAMKIFRNDCPYFSAPVNEVTINGESFLKYELGNFKPIENLIMKMSGSEFIRLLKNLINPMIECSDWMIDSHYFMLTPQLVFVGSYDYNVRYIYSFDLDNFCSDAEISGFFAEIIKNVRLTDSAELSNILLRMVVDGNVSVASLLDLIGKYDDRSKKDIPVKREIQPQKESVRQPQREASVPSNEPIHKESKSGVGFPKIMPATQPKPEKPAPAEAKPDAVNPLSSERDRAMEELFGGKKTASKSVLKTKEKGKEKSKEKGMDSILSFLKKDKNAPNKAIAPSNNMIEVPANDETVFAGAYDDGVTEIAGADPYLALKENNGSLDAPKRIELSFDANGEMYIGRQSESSNYFGYKFSADFKKISRRHVLIKRVGTEYSVTDMNSANKTFINGQILQPNTAYKISDGDMIVFGDSLYVYEFKEM